MTTSARGNFSPRSCAAAGSGMTRRADADLHGSGSAGLYGGISDFGRSIVRPMALWAASILIFTLVYLGLRRSEYFASALGPIGDGAPVFPPWPAEAGIGSVLTWIGSAISWVILSIFNLFAGGGCIAGDTGATGEALFLALKNSLFFLGLGKSGRGPPGLWLPLRLRCHHGRRQPDGARAARRLHRRDHREHTRRDPAAAVSPGPAQPSPGEIGGPVGDDMHHVEINSWNSHTIHQIMSMELRDALGSLQSRGR